MAWAAEAEQGGSPQGGRGVSGLSWPSGSPLVCRPTSAYDHIAVLSTSPSSSSLPSVGSPGTPPRHAGLTGPPNCGRRSTCSRAAWNDYPDYLEVATPPASQRQRPEGW
jgi:hypothetical protein